MWKYGHVQLYFYVWAYEVLVRTQCYCIEYLWRSKSVVANWWGGEGNAFEKCRLFTCNTHNQPAVNLYEWSILQTRGYCQHCCQCREHLGNARTEDSELAINTRKLFSPLKWEFKWAPGAHEKSQVTYVMLALNILITVIQVATVLCSNPAPSPSSSLKGS